MMSLQTGGLLYVFIIKHEWIRFDDDKLVLISGKLNVYNRQKAKAGEDEGEGGIS